MKKLLLTLLTIFATVSTVSAQETTAQPFPQDGSPITTGEVYSVKMFQNYNGTLTPSVSGTLIQDGAQDLKLEGLTEAYLGYGTYGQQHTWQVEEGKTYTISNPGAVWDDGYVTFYMEAEQGIQVLRANPADGSILSPNVNQSGDITYLFNTSVEIDKVEISVGDVMIEADNTSNLPNTVIIPVKSLLVSLYADGTLSDGGGETITVKLVGLQSTSGTLYNGDGIMTFTYVAAERLVDLVSAVIPDMLKSYYPEGDPEGIWTFTFDQDLMDDGNTVLTITCGNPQSEDMYYHESIVPTIDGGTLTFDLTDKVRELQDYLAKQEIPGVAIKVENVRDTKGRMALGSGAGNIGSYPYTLGYNQLLPQALAKEFTPAAGTSLVGCDEIEIWFNNADKISFDGVEFNYHTDSGFETAVVLNSDLNIDVIDNEVTIKVAVPEVVKGHDQITVKLYNMKSIDGYNYDISALYDLLVIDLVSPIRPGETIATTGTEDFVFNINLADTYYYYRYDFYNTAGEDGSDGDGWAYGTSLTKQDNGTWTAPNLDFVCYTDFDPYMVVSAYYFEDDFNFGKAPDEQYTFTFHGATEPFTYSDVKFVSINPEPDSAISVDDWFCFEVQYDGLVAIDPEASGIIIGMGMGVLPFDYVEPASYNPGDQEGYSDTWLLYPSVSWLESCTAVDISIFAKDINGKVVKGNMGAGEHDCLQFSYSIKTDNNLVDLVVVPSADEPVTSLKAFTISYNGMDVTPDWNYSDNPPKIMNWDTFETVYEFKEEDIELMWDGSVVMTCPEITEPGTYSFAIPEGYFIIGEQFTTYYNNLYLGIYTVTGSTGISSIAADKNGKYEVYNLQGIEVMVTADATALDTLATGLYIINGKMVYVR